MNATQSVAVFEGVAKSYDGIAALKGISFDIKKGEVFGFIGPNGAGKTTTMKIMVGLIAEFSGSLTVDGLRMPSERSELYRSIGYMPQSIAFQDWRTVDHALMTFGRLSGMDRATLAKRIPQVLDQVGLADARARKIIHLSGGMVPKLGLAQALLHQPRLLVLDEPVAGMDPASRIQVKAIIRELGNRGSTVFFSSHILSDVQDVADRIGILSAGTMLKIGTLDELKRHFSVNDDIEIVLSHDTGTWSECRGVAGVLSLERVGEARLLLRVAPEANVEGVANEVLRRLVTTGQRIRSFKPLMPSLDELYMKYVGEGGAI